MKRLLMLAAFAALSTLPLTQIAQAGHSQYDALIATHAAANNVPEALVHRVIQRESRYQPNLVGRCGCIGLMQIKLATARGLGYTGDAAGLRDPETNLTYGVKYLAGAWRAANSDHARAMRFYASGYYYVARRQRLERLNRPGPALASAPPKEIDLANDGSAEAKEAAAEPKSAVNPQEADNPPRAIAATTVPMPRKRPKKLAEAKPQVPRPPGAVGSANAANPR
jgi:transglycosylase-like protein with SLT domain